MLIGAVFALSVEAGLLGYGFSEEEDLRCKGSPFCGKVCSSLEGEGDTPLAVFVASSALDSRVENILVNRLVIEGLSADVGLKCGSGSGAAESLLVNPFCERRSGEATRDETVEFEGDDCDLVCAKGSLCDEMVAMIWSG